ncbi:MAG: PLDc_N domain-containing protein [Chloroflexi bacterium]|nr:PLDc_N domain-containing protein [Chloroflexota bacterium]
MNAQLILLLIPLVIIEIGLMVFSLVDLVGRERVKGGDKLLWGAIVVLVGIVGPVVYFLFGREE